MIDVTTEEAVPSAETFAPEPAMLHQTKDGQWIRYPLGSKGFSPGGIVWTNPQQWAANCDKEDWQTALLSSRPDLCSVDDVRAHSFLWKLMHVWPALLAIARTPGAMEAPTEGPDTEEDMAKKASKKVAKAGSGNGTARGRKSSLNPAAKLVFADKFKLREGSAAAKRFAEVRSGSTVKTALEKGLTAADINWHVKKGNLTLTD